MRGRRGGKFCRGGINCRGRQAVPDTKSPYFIEFSAMARRLLILGFRGVKAALCGVCRSSAMLFALGAASSALDAIQSLTSPASSSSQSTGFSQATADMFGLAPGASTSGNSTLPSGTTGFSQISPATMSALLAAQGQSSTQSTTSASTGGSQVTATSAVSTTSSSAASSSYNAIEQQREANAISFSASPLSFSV
jgi:hypothetical protein